MSKSLFSYVESQVIAGQSNWFGFLVVNGRFIDFLRNSDGTVVNTDDLDDLYRAFDSLNDSDMILYTFYCTCTMNNISLCSPRGAKRKLVSTELLGDQYHLLASGVLPEPIVMLMKKAYYDAREEFAEYQNAAKS